jgi:hypothetical protein
MRSKYLGDSFDIVKRFWADRLAAIAPVFAHPNFVPVGIRPEYEKMICTPVALHEFNQSAKINSPGL